MTPPATSPDSGPTPPGSGPHWAFVSRGAVGRLCENVRLIEDARAPAPVRAPARPRPLLPLRLPAPSLTGAVPAGAGAAPGARSRAGAARGGGGEAGGGGLYPCACARPAEAEAGRVSGGVDGGTAAVVAVRRRRPAWRAALAPAAAPWGKWPVRDWRGGNLRGRPSPHCPPPLPRHLPRSPGSMNWRRRCCSSPPPPRW